MSYHSINQTQTQVNDALIQKKVLSSWNNTGESIPSTGIYFVNTQTYSFQYDIQSVAGSSASIRSYSLNSYSGCTVSNISITDDRYLNFDITVSATFGQNNAAYIYADFHTFSGTNQTGTQYNDYFRFRARTTTDSKTVTFNANGGSTTLNTSSKITTHTDITIPSSQYLTPPTGQTFKEWNTASNGTGTSYTVGSVQTIDSDLTLYAIWKCTVTVIAVSNGTLTRTVGTTTTTGQTTVTVDNVTVGSIWACNSVGLLQFSTSAGNATVTPVASSGYFWDTSVLYSPNGPEISVPYEGTITQSFTIYVHFHANYTVTLVLNPSGSSTFKVDNSPTSLSTITYSMGKSDSYYASGNSLYIHHGTATKVNVTDNPPYYFDDESIWTDQNGTIGSSPILVTSNRTITANLTIKYTVSFTTSAESGSSGTVDTQSIVVPINTPFSYSGSKVIFGQPSSPITTVEARPGEESEFSRWITSATGTTITSATTFTAYFIKARYTYSFIASRTLSADFWITAPQYEEPINESSVTVSSGDIVSCECVPRSGFGFVEWQDYDGNVISSANPITFTANKNTNTYYKAIIESYNLRVSINYQSDNQSNQEGKYWYSSLTVSGPGIDEPRQYYGTSGSLSIDLVKSQTYTITWNGNTEESGYKRLITAGSTSDGSYYYQQTLTDSYVMSYLVPNTDDTQTLTPPDAQPRETDGIRDYYRLSLTLNANGGTFGENVNDPVITSQWALNNQYPPMTLTQNRTPTKSGYTFTGWAISPSATDAQYRYGSEINNGVQDIQYGAHTLYAVWKAGYLVTIVSGNTVRGSVSPTEAYVEPEHTITITATPNTGYAFGSWSLNPIESTTPKAEVGDTAQTTFKMGSVPITVTASFVYEKRYIYFKTNDGTDNTFFDTYITNDGKLNAYPQTDPTRSASGGYTYTFLEWNTEADGSGEAVEWNTLLPLDVTAIGNIYAIWQAPVVEITVIPNDGTPSYTAEVILGENYTLPSVNPVDGKYFYGWCIGSLANTNKIGDPGDLYPNTQQGVTAPFTILGYWKDLPTITFNANGGEFIDTGMDFTTRRASLSNDGEHAYIPLSMLGTVRPTFEPYTFLYWEYNGVEVTPATQFDLGNDYTLYAKWEVDTQYITINIDGPDNVSVGTYFTYYANVFNDGVLGEGWQIVRWELESGGSNSNPSIFSLTEDGDGDSKSIRLSAREAGYTVGLRAYCSVDATKYSNKLIIASTTDTSVAFYSDGVLIDTIQTTGILQSLPTTPVKEGYEFNGWYTSTGVKITVGSAIPYSINAYANYTIIESSDTLGKDVLILQVLNKQGDAVMRSMNMGSIQTFSENYSIRTTSTPTPTTSSERTFAIDMYITETITVKFERVSPPDYDDDDMDSSKWSNAKWYRELKYIVNRWQGETDGLKLLYLPIDCKEVADGIFTGQKYRLIGTPNDSIGYLYNGQRYLGMNCYIKSFTPTYTAGSPELLSGDLTFYVGGVRSNYVRWSDD